MPAAPVHHTDTTTASWDGPGQVKNLGTDYTLSDLKKTFAWLPAGDDVKKGDCSLPHHEVSTDGVPGAANVSGCQSAIGVLNGAMGGADLPDADRQKTYDHLAAHLKDADVEPAELKSAPPAPAAEPPAPITSPTLPTSPTAPQAPTGPQEVHMAPMPGTILTANTANKLGAGAGPYVTWTALPAAPTSGPWAIERGVKYASPVMTVNDVRKLADGTNDKPVNSSARATLYNPAQRTRERRSTPFRDVDMRAVPNGTGGTVHRFSGYACITEVGYEMYDWLGPFQEVVRQGAFAKTLSENADVAFLINHDGLTLARTKSGTLRLSEDDTGLYVEADLDPANHDVQDLASAMGRKDVDEMSFAFWVMRQQWSPDFEQRDILEVSLNKGDVSAVNYGANPNTTAEMNQLNARELAHYVEHLPQTSRRELFVRLAADTAYRTAAAAAPGPANPFLQYAPLDSDTARDWVARQTCRAWLAERAAEMRAGKALSADTMTTLTRVLDLVAAADKAVDEAQPLLADLMGVANPDDPAENDPAPNGTEGTEGTGSGSEMPVGDVGVDQDEQSNAHPLDLYQARLRRLTLH